MIKVLSQRGAMFGLDARITLVIAAIIGLAAGFNHIRKLDAAKIEETKLRMAKVKDAYLRYYETTGGSVPADEGDLTTTDNFGQPFLKAGYESDAWGNLFMYIHNTAGGAHIEDSNTYITNLITSFTSHIISAGPDGVFNHDYMGSYQGAGLDELPSNMEALIVGDDIMMKVNTFDIDQKRLAQGNKQLAEIKAKIEALAEHNRIRWQRYCEATGGTPAGCDYNADGTYVRGEEMLMNFFPYATEVVAGCPASRPFYADNASFSRSYTSGNLASMQALMTVLGLPQSYAQFGNILRYDSNDGNRCSGPFNFKIWYY